MKIKITYADEWIRANRYIEVGHVFNVLKDRYGNYQTGVERKYVKREGRTRDVRWYFIATHGNKNIMIYDFECEVIEKVETGFVQQLKEMLKQI